LGIIHIVSVDAAESSTNVGLSLSISKNFDLDISVGSDSINMVARPDPATGKYTAAQVEWINPGPINTSVPSNFGQIPITFTLGCALPSGTTVMITGTKYTGSGLGSSTEKIFRLINVGQDGSEPVPGEAEGPAYIEFEIVRLNGTPQEGVTNYPVKHGATNTKLGISGTDIGDLAPGDTWSVAINFTNPDDLANGGTFVEGVRYEETLTFTFTTP
jgi:hypothetical protein